MSDSPDVLRQLMKSRAPSISFGRTQVDYVDRLAAKLQISQRTKPNERLEAVGILGSDTYDKLLILQGLRKFFPAPRILPPIWTLLCLLPSNMTSRAICSSLLRSTLN